MPPPSAVVSDDRWPSRGFSRATRTVPSPWTGTGRYLANVTVAFVKRRRGPPVARAGRDANLVKPSLLGLLLVLACATNRGSAPDPAPDGAPVVDAQGGCARRATVDVHVDNRGSTDIEIAFGSYAPARAAPGLSRTTYRVPRAHLRQTIQLRIARGGLGVGRPARVPTENVVCNDATLIIGPEPRYSFFYGDLIVNPPGKAQPQADSTDTLPPPTTCCTPTIRALVPEGTGAVYLAGNLPALGPWRPHGLRMTGAGRERTARVTAPRGTVLAYKFTLGGWDREALGPEGLVPPNNRLTVDGDVGGRTRSPRRSPHLPFRKDATRT